MDLSALESPNSSGKNPEFSLDLTLTFKYPTIVYSRKCLLQSYYSKPNYTVIVWAFRASSNPETGSNPSGNPFKYLARQDVHLKALTWIRSGSVLWLQLHSDGSGDNTPRLTGVVVP